MEEKKIKIWILHAGIEHPSPYFYNFCLELNNYKDYEYAVNPNLPLNELVNKGIVYFNRLKRFYNSEDFNTARTFLNNVDILKQKGWKIVWTVHNFFPIDRKLSDIDTYVTKEFISRCDLVFTLSEYMKNSIKKYYGINAICHGMGMSNLNSNNINPKIKSLKKNYMFTFTFVGNIYKYKMIDKIILSFNKMKDCRLIIAGRESKNAGVNIQNLVSKNKNIIYIDSFIDKNDWNALSKITDVFISIYDFKYPAFKYGFFPSNYINIAQTGIKCISPRNEIIEEMICEEQAIFYNFDDENGLYNAMIEAKKSIYNRVPIKLKYNYSWREVVNKFINNCNKLF